LWKIKQKNATPRARTLDHKVKSLAVKTSPRLKNETKYKPQKGKGRNPKGVTNRDKPDQNLKKGKDGRGEAKSRISRNHRGERRQRETSPDGSPEVKPVTRGTIQTSRPQKPKKRQERGGGKAPEEPVSNQK
jgi:hypothetical protein